MNIEQAELLSKIAMHVRSVSSCDFTNNADLADRDVPGCLMCEAYRAGLVSKEDALATDNDYPNVGEYFGVSDDDWLGVLMHRGISEDAEGCIPGQGYYRKIESLLTKYDKLHVMRRMEGRLMPIVVGETA